MERSFHKIRLFKKFGKEIEPSTIAKWFSAKDSGNYNEYGSHPDGKERGLQLNRGLERLGSTIEARVIGSIFTTGKTINKRVNPKKSTYNRRKRTGPQNRVCIHDPQTKMTH
jgi:hypothetical protein